MSDQYLPQTIQQASKLRIRRPGAGENGKTKATNGGPSSPDANQKGPKPMTRTRRFMRYGLAAGLWVVAILVACKPFFPNFFEETNFFLHHMAQTVDHSLMKHRQYPDHKIIYYLHLSKCGGTSVMDAAHASGLSVPIRNGLTQRDWRCCGNDDSLEAQADYAKISPFDLVANEGDMYDAMDTEHYDYVVTLRDSRARYKSMWEQWGRDPIMAMNPMDFEQFAAWFAEDNFIFRKICGTKCRGVPKYKIPQELFMYTLTRLEKFDSILFLEDFQESYAKFAAKHGWTSPEQKKRVWGNNKSASKEEEKGWDWKMSALDDALYEYATRVDQGLQPFKQFTQRTQENVDIYFQDIFFVGNKDQPGR